MVKYKAQLNSVFSCLSDETRRDILSRLVDKEMTVSEIAKPYKMSLAAFSKHLKILEKAKLVIKRRKGKEQWIRLAPMALKDASLYLHSYRLMWEERFDSLEQYLNHNS